MENNAHAHPISILINRIAEIFTSLGFDIVDGPELEREWFNFDALNVPKDHPARDLQDTFYLKLKEDEKYGKAVMRTHTSPVQVHYMTEFAKLVKEGKKDFPLAICVPGKTFRNEATDATHEAQFYQVEGLLVGENISLANLKGVLEKFFSELFEKKIDVMLRSSFFPFVEPGVEIAMKCFKCDGAGCNICKKTGWIEIMGAGMVHPNVLENCGIDSRKYTGFAFGGGIERLAMLKYGINDIRLFHNGDLRMVNQF
ncbi:Phenylalanine--tRNA ligase alpha subunit [bioreactor metagenome]|uniref:phenylalanine--tRNA ligase n=1 Tax=bioreactor metagenome TaxID=1076179 RepID=A0A644V884_9ZZZZ|nr:phenylalanine--tRNA ligase subunit alpha [Candidatus Elulimicrobiales bacterium]